MIDHQSGGGERPPKLLDQLRAVLRARHYSRRTEEAYSHWVRRFILFHHLRHPAEMNEPEINAFLTHLAVKEKVSASTQNQALCALLFLYRKVIDREVGQLGEVVRARKPKRLPVVMKPGRRLGPRADAGRPGPKISQRACGLALAMGVSSREPLEEPQNRRGGAASPPRDHPAASSQGGRCQSGDRQACRLPHVAAFVRNSFTGRWLRHSDHPGIVGAYEREHHDDLYACAQQGRPWCTQPRRRSVDGLYRLSKSSGIIWWTSVTIWDKKEIQKIVCK